jgi:hypothetical protein
MLLDMMQQPQRIRDKKNVLFFTFWLKEQKKNEKDDEAIE